MSLAATNKQNQGQSPSKLLIKKDRVTNRQILTPRSNQMASEIIQQSTNQINVAVLESELGRVRSLYEKEAAQKWSLIHEKNALQNSIKILSSEKANTLLENQKIRKKVHQMINTIQKLNTEKIQLLSQVHHLGNSERILLSKINNLECAIKRQKQNHETYQIDLKHFRTMEKDIVLLNYELADLRNKNREFEEIILKQKKQKQAKVQQINFAYQEKMSDLQKLNKTLKDELQIKKKELSSTKNIFLKEKQKINSKTIQLQRSLNFQREQFQAAVKKLQQSTQFDNKKLMMDVSTGENKYYKQIQILKSECYQKEIRIHYLSRQIFDLQFQLRNASKNSVTVDEAFLHTSRDSTLRPTKQFNLQNLLQTKILRIKELEAHNKILEQQLFLKKV